MKRLFMNSCFNLISIFVGLIISMSLSLISNAKRVESPNVVFNEDKCEVSFAATMDDDGYYRVIVWVSPYRVIDEYVSYDVSINGILIKDALQFDKLGWQYSEVISKNGIYLKKGENTISIIGSLPVIPSIEHIEISNNDTYVSERINTILYKPENYILSGESIYSPADQEWQLLDPQYDAPYSYTYKLDVSCEYSFIKTMSLKKGEKLSISSNSPNNVSHAIFVFRNAETTIFGQSFYSQSSTFSSSPSLTLIVPEDGTYEIRLRTYLSGSKDLCWIKINDALYLEQVSCTEIKCTINGSQLTNTFTRNNSNSIRLFVENKSALLRSSIKAYNYGIGRNEYESQYNWSNCNRIRGKIGSDCNLVTISSFKSSVDQATCDIYIGMQEDSEEYSPANILSQADRLISHEDLSQTYNCHAWAGGIYTTPIHPEYIDLENYDYDACVEFRNLHPDLNWDKQYFDRYYAMERYPGSSIFIECDEDDPECVIDLWEIDRKAPSDTAYTVETIKVITHSSIRNGADSNHHGFAWESKLAGHLNRIFHPRYGLSQDDYGIPRYHYKLSNNGFNKSRSGKNRLNIGAYNDPNSISFDTKETQLLHSIYNEQITCNNKDLNSLLEKWKFLKDGYLSNYSKISELENEIYNILGSSKYSILITFESICNGDNEYLPLISKYIIKDKSSIKELWKNELSKINELDINGIGLSLKSKCVLYAKLLLKDYIGDSKMYNNTAVILEDDKLMLEGLHIVAIDGKLTINYELDKISDIRITVNDITGSCLYDERFHERETGKHNKDLRLAINGTVIVHVVINDKVFFKRVMI